MTPVDYALIGIVLLSALLGIFRGLVREVLTLLTWLIALWAAWRFAAVMLPLLGTGSFSKPPLQIWAARGLMFLGVMLLGSVIAAVVAQIVRTSMFSALDRFLGFVFGALRGLLVIGVVVMLAQRSGLDQQVWWGKSKLLPIGEGMASLVHGWVGERLAPSAETGAVRTAI
jgi:membrane protein required for colicin V production